MAAIFSDNHDILTYMLNIKLFTFLLTLGLLTSCAHRGLIISEQIPEEHPKFVENTEQIFSEGGLPNKVVFANLGGNEYRRNYHEQVFVNEQDELNQKIKQHFNSSFGSNGGRSIASKAEGNNPAAVFYSHSLNSAFKGKLTENQSRRPASFNKINSNSITYNNARNFNLHDLAIKYYGDANKWIEIIKLNPHLIRIEKGDRINLPKAR